MAIHLVTLVGGEGWRTLEPMLEHYRGLNVDDFKVTMHLSSPEDPVRERVLDITRRFGCGVYATVIGKFADVQQESYAKPRRDYPRDWFALADTDEFHRPEVNLPDMTAECEKHEYEFVRGAMIDRVTEDGTIPELNSSLPIADQFPLGCIVTPVIQNSQPRKVVLVHGSIKLEYGQHFARFGNPCPRSVFYTPVHHFKWHSGIVEATRRRANEFREEGRDHWVVSQKLVDHVQENRGRLNVAMPELMAGPCDPEYSRWDEYKERLFDADRYNNEPL